MQSFNHPECSCWHKTRHQHGSLSVQTVVGPGSLRGCHRQPQEGCQNGAQPITGHLLCPAHRRQPIRGLRASVIVPNCSCAATHPQSHYCQHGDVRILCICATTILLFRHMCHVQTQWLDSLVQIKRNRWRLVKHTALRLYKLKSNVISSVYTLSMTRTRVTTDDLAPTSNKHGTGSRKSPVQRHCSQVGCCVCLLLCILPSIIISSR